MNYLKLLTTTCLFLGFQLLMAQEMPVTDVVYLKDGSLFKGEILEYDYGTFLRLKRKNGQVLTFPADQIDKVVQEDITSKGENPYRFKEKGIYNVTYGSINPGSNAWDGDLIGGLGIHNVTGYQFNRWIGAGIGFGADLYYLGAGETLYPLFGEIRGYLSRKNVSPYYAFAGGYGFAFKDEDRNIVEAEGGMMLHPAVGFRLGADSQANFTIDLGVKWQKATFSRAGFGETTTNRMLYQRFTLRMGLLF